MQILIIYLIPITILLTSFLPKEKYYLIIDDCQRWEDHSRGDGYFYITNYNICCVAPYYTNDGKDSTVHVSLFNGDIEMNSPTVEQITLPQLLKTGVRRSSELSYQDWKLFNSEENELYIILPDDYCTTDRFVHEKVFTAYKTKILTDHPSPGPDLIEYIDPMNFFRIDSSKVRTRKKD